jgi:4-hydroxy-3-methylbut-2-en-1-yl diphosphate reductase
MWRARRDTPSGGLSADPGLAFGRRQGGAKYDVLVVERILLASPRGYCAGVERAVDTVEQALELWGAPVYVRKQIVHNAHVVRELEERGAIFVDSETEIPPGSTAVFSAHGVAPSVHENARRLKLQTIDATCPLVTKVHSEAQHYAADGYTILLIGHAGHEEVEGTMGEAPESIILVQSAEEAELIEVPETDKLAYITQTTLSVDETNEIIDVLRRRFPEISAPKRDDICYATTNRQRAVKAMLPDVDLLLVIGSHNSSNSNRLVEVARASGVPSYLIDDETEIEETWLEGVETIGITSGASAPESLVRRVLAWFRERGVEDVRAHAEELEDVFFKLPVEIRRRAAV